MIVDVHSHVFRDPESFPGAGFRDGIARAHGGPVDLTVRYEDYRAGAPDDTVTVVFGGKARLSGLWVDDAYVAAYVRTDPDRLIGFLSLDPTQPGWQDEMRDGHEELGLRGIKLLPMYAGFRPDDPASTRSGSTPSGTAFRSCCTRGRRSWRRHRWSTPCRGTSTRWRPASPR